MREETKQPATTAEMLALLAPYGFTSVSAASMSLAWQVYEILRAKDHQVAALEAQLARLKSGKFTPEEIHGICHDLHGTVSAAQFADGCAAEQKKLYGCAPDREQIQSLTAMKEQNAGVAFLVRRIEALEEALRSWLEWVKVGGPPDDCVEQSEALLSQSSPQTASREVKS